MQVSMRKIGEPMATMGGNEDRRGLYSIAIAAELVGVGIQTLRLYESKGLVEPARTPGGTRRYSDADVHTIRRVIALTARGVNIAGVRMIIDLEDENEALRLRTEGA